MFFLFFCITGLMGEMDNMLMIRSGPMLSCAEERERGVYGGF